MYRIGFHHVATFVRIFSEEAAAEQLRQRIENLGNVVRTENHCIKKIGKIESLIPNGKCPTLSEEFFGSVKVLCPNIHHSFIWIVSIVFLVLYAYLKRKMKIIVQAKISS